MNSDSDIDDALEDRDEQRDYIRSVERAINVGQRGFANIGGRIITKLGYIIICCNLKKTFYKFNIT